MAKATKTNFRVEVTPTYFHEARAYVVRVDVNFEYREDLVIILGTLEGIEQVTAPGRYVLFCGLGRLFNETQIAQNIKEAVERYYSYE